MTYDCFYKLFSIQFKKLKYFFNQKQLDEAAETSWSYCQSQSIAILSHSDLKGSLLFEISSPPTLLYLKGNVELIWRRSFSVVGTRKPSDYGMRSAYILSKALAENGWVIVSGLARGIDTKSHQACLSVGGQTTAVLAHGLDRIYPSENTSLSNKIIDTGGLLMSEYPPFVSPHPAFFPERNRLIAGLSSGVVVVEAAMKSGSLITAREALHIGRDVYVVPGGFNAKSFEGSHRLIQDGAKLVTCVEDIQCEFENPKKLNFFNLSEELNIQNASITLESLASLNLIPISEILKEVQGKLDNGDWIECAPQRYINLVNENLSLPNDQILRKINV